MAQLTPQGFITRSLEDIINEISGNLKATFGMSFDTSPESPDGQLIGIFAEQIFNAEQAAQAVYQSSDPDVAVDAQLEFVCDYTGVFREEARSTIAILQFTGTSGTVIPEGTLVGTVGGLTFSTDTSGLVGEDVSATCTDEGAIPVQSGELTELLSIIAGVTEVTNRDNAVTGRIRESNAQLRNRRAFSTISEGTNTTEAIYSDLLRLGASFVSVQGNDTTEIVEGIPPNSFQTLVVGLSDDVIANAIFAKKPLGIKAFGSIIETVLDINGYPHLIGFSRPTDGSIDVTVTYRVILGASSEIEANIQANITNYITTQIDIGEDIVWSDIFGAAIQGSIVNGSQASIRSVLIGKSGSPLGTVDIPMTQVEKAVAGTITVSEVA